MPTEIKESDWKLFRRLHRIALERFCERVLLEVRAATTEHSENYHASYLKIFALIQDRNKTMARAFDDMRRSKAFVLLANIKQLDLLTDEELMQFGPETRDAIEAIESMRRG